MSMILLVFGICWVLLLCFRLPFTQLYDHEKAKQLAPNLPPQSILIIIIKKFLAIPYKSSCSSGIFVLFTVSPCTILFSCLSCIGICLSTRSWWFWLTWFLGHSNVLIKMTVIIPPMTKHARLRHNSLPENIFLLFHSLRNFLAKM